MLAGYRTYIMVGVAIIGAVANYMVGDADLATTITAVAQATALGYLRKAI